MITRAIESTRVPVCPMLDHCTKILVLLPLSLLSTCRLCWILLLLLPDCAGHPGSLLARLQLLLGVCSCFNG